ncbi:glycoside hydrolase family 1 protein [bacterium]|nr:glycoside hydrolase family 1 protein [bacterium]
MERILRFPQNFLWGCATSAYQVEGGIKNADWSKFKDAGIACDHYHRYEQDFDLLEKLNQNAYRFSIEWSRIEAREAEFNEKEIQHYKRMLLSLRKRQIKAMVTLHHFTVPLWMAKKGGWENKKSIFYFSRFCKKIMYELGDLVDFWITINEPLIYAKASYLEGRWPPAKKNFLSFMKVIKNQIEAHKRVYFEFHQINKEVKVGLAKNNSFFEPFNPKSPLDKFSSYFASYFGNNFFLDKIRNQLDFIGLNYYFHNRIKFPFYIRNENKIVSDLGWEIFPEGIYHVLKDLKRYKKTIFITENGVADANDILRKDFIKQHLYQIYRAIKDGANVGGYFHWSLMDNFEWEKGFEPRFGLIAIDYNTLERKPRPSAFYYANISKENALIVEY